MVINLNSLGRSSRCLQLLVIFHSLLVGHAQENSATNSGLYASSAAFSSPEILSPGGTNDPGPVLEHPTVTFSWKPVPDATLYSISLRSLLSSNLLITNVPATETSLTLELRKHPYRWNMRAWKGEMESEFSETFYFRIEASSGRPVITGITPSPVAGQPYKQHFTINGRDFFSGCIVNLRDKADDNHLYRDVHIELQTIRQITINPNFSSQTADWSVQVVNPLGESSGEYLFRVLSPEDMAKFKSKREHEAKLGWAYFKWTLAVALAAGFSTAIFSIVLLRRHRKHRREAHRLGAGEERRFLADELHDGFGADLVKAMKMCERLQSISNDDERKNIVSKLQGALLSAKMHVEDLLWAAKPENQQFDWLIGHLRQNVNSILDAAKISFRLEFPPTLPENPVSAELCNHVLLLTKEALNNVVKHSGAGNVMIGLQIEDTNFQLVVRDDGKGFDSSILSSGSGLRNMRRRMEKLGGTFNIKSTPGSGTCIHVSVPSADTAGASNTAR